jgi:hypothetical protein
MDKAEQHARKRPQVKELRGQIRIGKDANWADSLSASGHFVVSHSAVSASFFDLLALKKGLHHLIIFLL